MVEKLTNDQIAKNVEDELDRMVESQWSIHANIFNHCLSQQIQLLERIRGRRYIKCNECKTDLTLSSCTHNKQASNWEIKE